MATQRILLVGTGGIGSWLAQFIAQALEANQIDGQVTIADPDQVDLDNITFQNFSLEDIGEFKVEALASRFPLLEPLNKKLVASDLENYDIIISAVDNTEFRKHLFSSGKRWIDLRCEGRQVAAFTSCKENTVQQMLATIPEDKADGSCQRAQDKLTGKLQNGNKIIAAIGSQLLLNLVRGDKNPAKIILSV